MGAISRMFRLFGQAATAFFRHDLALRRGKEGVVIVLEPRGADGARARRARGRDDEAQRKARAELELVLLQLQALLDEIPGARTALKQLVFIEQALHSKGLKALHRLPLPVLQKGLEQLEGLVTNWSAVGLANLRSKIAVAIIDREHQDPSKEADAHRTAAVLEPAESVVAGSTRPHRGPDEVSDDEALAAAYAQLGAVAPAGPIELQGELGSRSARAMASSRPRAAESGGDIQIRKLEQTASI